MAKAPEELGKAATAAGALAKASEAAETKGAGLGSAESEAVRVVPGEGKRAEALDVATLLASDAETFARVPEEIDAVAEEGTFRKALDGDKGAGLVVESRDETLAKAPDEEEPGLFVEGMGSEADGLGGCAITREDEDTALGNELLFPLGTLAKAPDAELPGRGVE